MTSDVLAAPDTVAGLGYDEPDHDHEHLCCNLCQYPPQCKVEGRAVATLCGLQVDPDTVPLEVGDTGKPRCERCYAQRARHERLCWQREEQA